MAATAGPFLQSLTAAPHDFLQPSLPLHTDALAYLKNALDPVALDISAAQQQRLLDARKKRKRGEVVSEEEVLRLKQVHTRGFAAEQVWEQAKRVIEAARKEAEVGLAEAEAREAEESGSESGEEGESELGEEGVDWTYDGEDVGSDGEEEEGSEEEDEEMVDGEEAHDDYQDEDEDVEMGSDLDGEDDARAEEPVEDFVEDKFGLNDGFFSIDNFNKQSEFMEQQGDEEAGSDDEDIDWDADPATMAAAAGAAGADGGAEEESDDEEDGPTFGDPDAPSEDEDEDLEGGDMDIGGMGNTNNVMYADFFAPPAQKARKNKKGRPNPHNFPAKGPATENEGQDEDMTRTMEAVHRDLFEDESEEEDEEDQETLDPADPKSRRSAHERRKLALQEEIRKLEAANVAKREWTLSGEARAADRPMNSLLEEDLEFERAGKVEVNVVVQTPKPGNGHGHGHGSSPGKH